MLAIGTASLLAALAYMGGPTIAYTPFGELTVFVFFGLVAVTAPTGADRPGRCRHLRLASLAIGAFAAAALAVNNHRDIVHDAGSAGAPSPWCSAQRVHATSSRCCWPCPSRCCRRSRSPAHSPTFAAAVAARAGDLGLNWRDFLACRPGGLAFNAVLFAAFRLELPGSPRCSRRAR